MTALSREAMMTVLSQDQVRKFREEGYVLPEAQVFDEAEFQELLSIFEEDLDRYGEEDLDVMHERDARLFKFLLHDAVLDLIQPLVGSDIGLWSSHFISKPPYIGRETPWHEDAAYWNGRMDNWESVVTVWVALDPVDTDNGCMRVVPGSHLTPFSQYEEADTAAAVFDRKIIEGSVEEEQAVNFVLDPNHCSIHDVRIIHGAKANTSDRRRAGYTMRYFSTASRVIPDQNVGHPIWLARGEDRAGNPFQPMLDR